MRGEDKWKIWNEDEEIAKSEEEAKKLVSLRFHKWIHVVATTSLRTTNRLLSKLKSIVSYRDYKRT